MQENLCLAPFNELFAALGSDSISGVRFWKSRLWPAPRSQKTSEPCKRGVAQTQLQAKKSFFFFCFQLNFFLLFAETCFGLKWPFVFLLKHCEGESFLVFSLKCAFQKIMGFCSLIAFLNAFQFANGHGISSSSSS